MLGQDHICQSGVDSKIQPRKVSIEIYEKHPLIRLGQELPWRELVELIIPDLKKTSAGCWWLGRKLKVRIHLGGLPFATTFQQNRSSDRI